MSRVPKLRFKEFSGEWEEKTLNDIAAKIQDGTHFSPTVLEKGTYKYITSKNIRNGYMDLSSVEYISEDEHQNIYRRCDVKFHDVLITKDGASTGNVCLNTLEEEFSLLSSVAFVRCNNSNAINEFLYQSICTPKGQYLIKSSMAGQAISRITLSKLRDFKFYFPAVVEQQKIASFLSSVDSKIDQLTRKNELLEQYKKGVMQKIFSQELRFKADDGSEFPEWEEKNGGKLFENISNKNHNSDLPILAISQEHGAIPRELINYQISVTDKSVDSYKIVDVGDFIISLRSFQGGIEYSNYKGICSPAYIILRNSAPINNLFYKSYFKTEYYIQRLCEKLEGIRDGKMISYKYFSEIELPYPSLPEQSKIASFITAIDDKIDLAAQQLEEVKQFKKGLLQQMFV